MEFIVQELSQKVNTFYFSIVDSHYTFWDWIYNKYVTMPCYKSLSAFRSASYEAIATSKCFFDGFDVNK